MKDKLLIIRNQLKMGHRLSFAEAILLQRAIDILVYGAGNSPVIPDGYVMVPKEPTKEILDEFDSIIDYGAEDSVDAWRRLLVAAPQEVK